MENASQALKIAAGMLFALLILGLLMAFYNNISELERQKQSSTTHEQAANFNKQYDVYVRDLYGSELLTLVNKADEYNKTEVVDKGYKKIEVTVKFKKDIIDAKTINGIRTIPFKKGIDNNFYYGIYKDKNGNPGIIEIMKRLEKVLDYYNEKTYGNGQGEYGKYTVQQLALMRSNQREQWYQLHNVNKQNAEDDVAQYTSFKADQVSIKSKVYSFSNSEYDSTTGRLIKFNYIEK